VNSDSLFRCYSDLRMSMYAATLCALVFQMEGDRSIIGCFNFKVGSRKIRISTLSVMRY